MVRKKGLLLWRNIWPSNFSSLYLYQNKGYDYNLYINWSFVYVYY